MYTLRSGGEVHIESLHYSPKRCFTLQSSDDIMAMLLLNEIHPIRELHILYLPYARQDRACNPGEPFSLKVMARLINSMGCEKVYLYNPHSSISTALIENSVEVSMSSLVPNIEGYVTAVPDQGAYKKLECAVFGVKRRVESVPVIVDVFGDVKDKNILVCDDICDGGRTFVEFAKILKEKGAKDLKLYTTYGIYSNGIDELSEIYSSIHYNVLINYTGDCSKLTKENFL